MEEKANSREERATEAWQGMFVERLVRATTFADLAGWYGVSPSTVRKWCHEHPKLVESAKAKVERRKREIRNELVANAWQLDAGRIRNALDQLEELCKRWVGRV